MNDIDPRTAPIREWNRLAQVNTENAIVSSMFEAGLVANEPIDTFSTWLLLGSAAVGGFLVSNAEKIMPLLTRQGFIACGAILVISCLVGVIAKGLALRVKVMKEAVSNTRKVFEGHLAAYREEEEQIQEGAKFWGITLQSGIRMNRVLAEFYKPLPSWVRWIGERNLRRNAGSPQIAYLPLVKALTHQGVFALLQTLLFLAFLGTAFIYAAAA